MKTLARAVIALVSFIAWSAQAAEYPPNLDYGQKGDFIVKRGTEFGRTANLTNLGPILVNMPESPGSSELNVTYRPEDTTWDLSDLTNPREIESLGHIRQPVAAHATGIVFDDNYGPLMWYGGDYLHYDASGPTLADQIDIIGEFDLPDTTHRVLAYPNLFSPYYSRTYWHYGFDTEGVYAVRDLDVPFTPTAESEALLGASENNHWLGEPMVYWNHLGLTANYTDPSNPSKDFRSVTGFTAWLGELLIVASDQQSTGIAIYDRTGIEQGNVPELITVFQPDLVQPTDIEGNQTTTSIGGYWMEPYGANKMVWAARATDAVVPNRTHPAFFVVDFSNPESPQLECEIYFDKLFPTDYIYDPEREEYVIEEETPEMAADGDISSDPMYVNFQDNYAYVDHFQVDMDACRTAYADGVISDAEFSQIVYKFEDLAHGCDSSQYFRPLGQVGIFGGYDFWVTEDVNEQGMCFMVTSDEPDTNPPYVSGHRPLADHVNYPIDGFIHIHVPETLRTETVQNAITVTNLDTGEDISYRHMLSHTGTISVWPNANLAENTEYQVTVTGIQDFMGNTMAPYSWVFSTGNEITSVPAVPTPNPDAVPTYDGLAYFPNQSGELSCDPETENGFVWAVNPDNDTVTIIEKSVDPSTFDLTLTVTREISLNYEAPTSVTKVNSVYAITYRDDDKVVIFNDTGVPIAAVDTGHGSQPVNSVADGDYLYVALYASGEVVKISRDDWEIVERVDVGPTPFGMAMHDERILVTRHVSTATLAEVYDLRAAASLSLEGRIPLNKVTVPDDIDHGSGIPNMLANIVINQDGTRAFVTASKSNIDRGTGEGSSGLPLDDDNSVRPMIVEIDLVLNQDANTVPSSREDTEDLDNGADPYGITYLADPNVRVHSLRGNNVVSVSDFSAGRSVQFNTGFAPQSLCASRRTLFVKNLTGRSVSAIDVAAFLDSGSAGTVRQEVVTVSNEKLTETELQGLRLFYHSSIPEMGPEGYITCATCHSDGGQDGMVWDMTSMGEGLRNTITLNGTAGTRFGELHWSGNFDEVQDFELQIENLNAGDGLVPGNTFTDQNPMTFTSSGLSGDLDALAAYIASLGKDSLRRSPYRTYTGELTESAQRGQAIFNNDNCATCHAGSAFRDGRFHDVGTIVSTSGNRLGESLAAIRTPTLVELWATAPYFHDGSAATLEDVLQRGGHAREFSAQDRQDLINFLLSIDREMFIDDDELFVPLAEDADVFSLTVENGSGGGNFTAGQTVSISALLPPDASFSGWTGDTESLADPSALSTSLIMPAADISVVANFVVVDLESPTQPSALASSTVTATTVSLNWTSASDNVGVSGYQVYVNGEAYRDTSEANTITLTGLSPETEYSITVVAFDEAGNQSEVSSALTVQTGVAASVDIQRTYFFGHSLIFHTNLVTEGGDPIQHSVPHWLYLMAVDGGKSFMGDGQFMPGTYTLDEAAHYQWGFDSAPPTADNGSFAASDHTSVVYTELNYVQYQGPDELDFEGGPSPVSRLLTVLDYVRAQEPGVPFYIYENWSDAGLSGYGGFPLDAANFADWHAENLGPFHNWWVELHDLVLTERPDSNVRLVPVGSIISRLLSESNITGLNEIPFNDLYEDSAPHGRPSLYFLAAMVQYMALFNEPTPDNYAVPADIIPTIRNNYSAIRNYIWQELNAFNFPGGESRVF